MTLTTGSGEEVTTGRLLDTTRRGEILEVTSAPRLVLKRYSNAALDADPTLERRLRAMISRSCAQWLEPDSHVNLAWPSQVVLDDGCFIGFLMPAMGGEDMLEFRRVASPSERRLAGGQASWARGFTWRYLVGTAANLANVTYLLHEAGVVIGDFSEDDLRVAADARVTILGCDSMQIRDRLSGEVFPALSGRRTGANPLDPSDDLRALSAHIHRLLLEGRDPAGHLDALGGPDLLPDTVNSMFRRESWGNGATAFQWHELLVRLGAEIVTCSQEPIHAYWSGLEKCPWCPHTASMSWHAISVVDPPEWPGADACPVNGRAVLRARVELGSPSRLQVTERELENVPYLRNAVTDGKEHEFCMLRITPTFHDDDDKFTFYEASVMVSLEISGRQWPDALRPRAWWMSPDREISPVHLTRSAQLAPAFQQISATLSTSADYQHDKEHIRAYGLNCPRAYWKLKRTPGREINGSYQLLMVVQMARTCTAEAAIEVTGIIERRKYRFRRRRGDAGNDTSRITLEPDAIRQAKIDIRVPGQ